LSSGLVFDLRKYSIHDGPGIRTAVFLKGCPLRCAWCHNPEGLSPEPEILRRPERCVAPSSAGGCGRCVAVCPLAAPAAGAAPGALAAPGGRPAFSPRDAAGGPACARCATFGACAEACPAEAIQVVGRRMSVGEAMAAILEDRPFYESSGGGATFSGGEPLAQPDFVLDLLRACREEGIRSALDTSGWAARDLVLEAGALADLVLFDLKLVDPERHEAATGVPSGPIIENLKALAAAGAKIQLRVPLVPGVNDSPGDLEAAAALAASLPGGPSVRVLPYHAAARGKYALRGRSYAMGDAEEPARGEAEAAAAVFARAGLAAAIGG
jgi:pyruvate formate lyase activating enzyme